jgi:hypothetical protein
VLGDELGGKLVMGTVGSWTAMEASHTSTSAGSPSGTDCFLLVVNSSSLLVSKLQTLWLL